MKLLTVIPIKKGLNVDTLSYFTGSEVEIGSVIRVPVRKKVVPAIVINRAEVTDVKAEIKNAHYETKKIEKIKSAPLFQPKFIEAVHEASTYFATTPGQILNATIPKAVLDETEKIKTALNFNSPVREHEKLIIQSDEEERYATYKSLIREEFARGHSVFFTLPTIQDIKKAFEKLSKGIEQYTVVCHGLLTKKEQIELWNQVNQEPHPVLIISTGLFLSLPRGDLGTIIIDKENSRSYKSANRPFLDTRTFAEILAKKIKAKIILGDMLLRTETVWRHSNAELFEVAPLKFRSLTTGSQQLIDMKETLPTEINKGDKNREPKFKLFSDEFLELVNKNQLNDENLFVFVARKGLFPTTVCADCGTLVVCQTCGSPTVLHKGKTENFFLCHRCGEHRSALEKCTNCQSWRLSAFGIGIESVEEELQTRFPQIKIFKIDSDSVSTHKKALETAEKFYASPGSILLGTEMALLYLKDTVANSAIVSIDSFFSIPDFRINEKIMSILLKIRANTSRVFVLQTRDSEQKIFKYALSGNLADFYREETKERKVLNYPPFSTTIKITLNGEKRKVLAGMEFLQNHLKPFEIEIFPAFVPTLKGKFSMHGVIKIQKAEWVNQELLYKLRTLSPEYSINVDPDSLL